MFKILVSGAAVVALGSAGCGSSSDSGGQATKTVVTVVREKVVERPASAEAASKRKPATAQPAAASQRAAGRIRVPDVVGKNHQYAQDTMQAVGLYNLDEEDATGQGRMLLWDRNWEVVEQVPAAGTMVTEDTVILLRSKKIGE